MSIKNIEMNYKSENGYDVLYPQSILGNVLDWQDNLYSKSQIDGIKTELDGDISNAMMTPGGWEKVADFEVGNMEGNQNRSNWVAGQSVQLDVSFSINYMYWFVITISSVAISVAEGLTTISLYSTLPNIDIISGIEDGISGITQKNYDFSIVLCGFPGKYNRNEWQIISGKGYNSSENTVNYFYVTSPFYYSSSMRVTNAYGGSTCHYTQNNLVVYRQKINSL